MGKRIEYIKVLIHSPKGRNAMIFMLFLALSAVLWVVQSLNEELQVDLRYRVNIINVPDTVTRLTPLPDAVNVTVKSRGTQLLKYTINKRPSMDIDYRRYRKGDRIQMNEAQLKTFFRDMIGFGSQIQAVVPDSLLINFTTNPGVMLPVKVNIKENFGPLTGVVREVVNMTDSVRYYSADPRAKYPRYIGTQQIVINDVSESQSRKVALLVPEGCRVIPDSVTVRFEVEPMVSKSVMVDITPVHVPPHIKVIPIPTQAEVYYMVPMSVYSTIHPKFRVEMDYNSIHRDNSGRASVTLTGVPDHYTNVFLAIDSVEYIIEQ